MIDFQNSVLVVAHPDDEILWFSTIIQNVDKIIIVFNKTNNQSINKGRDKILDFKLLPYKDKITCLKIEEADVFNKSNWKFPKVAEYGVNINSNKYFENFNKIKDKLFNHLKNYKNVITHNPWGEYGHEEHVQVFNVIKKISSEIDFSIWISGYFSEQSFRMMSLFKNFISKNSDRYKINNEFCQNVKNIYTNNDAWTWSNNYIWPEYETFFKLSSNFSSLNKSGVKTPQVWSQMNFILMYHVHSTRFSLMRSKLIQILELILPSLVFKILIKIKKQ